jgi:hypothetical protein
MAFSQERRLNDPTCAVNDGSFGVSAAGSHQIDYRLLVDANVLRTVFVSVEQKVPADFPVNEERYDNMKQSLSISP